ncbi:hypothetical protein [Embleya sp. NPDC020886]|uniref:hypothetical protein n=1 Tax=Embleya sp. NPDC020886 TaxID=3363980 RepID=UPI0037A1806D
MRTDPRHGPGSSADAPLFPVPPVCEQALRAAVVALDPAAAGRFEEDFRATWRAAVRADSTAPIRAFLHRWAVFVALRRVPARARRLRELERMVTDADTLAAARPAVAEVAAILTRAAHEATG